MIDQSFGVYSRGLEDGLWISVGCDYERDYEYAELLERINSPEFFRPFSERLLAFYNEVRCGCFSVDEAVSDLLHRGIDLSRNTLKSWFSGGSIPDYGDEDRRRMFALAFALALTPEQTERLFHKVFLDKAFNKRNAQEFVYLYCLCNNKTLSVAEELINKADSLNNTNAPADHTVQTQLLDGVARQGVSDDDLLQFISEHPHNFSLNHTAAKRHRQMLIDKLTGSTGGTGLAVQEYDRRRTELADDMAATGFENRDPSSVDFLLYTITSVDFIKSGSVEIRSIRETFPRKEIYNRFPNKQTLADKNPSSYVLRKDIIFLSFYSYWATDFLIGNVTGSYDGFVAGTNDVLFDCGFSPLYIGNPYDWLFLYCSACPTSPLDVFRGILAPD